MLEQDIRIAGPRIYDSRIGGSLFNVEVVLIQQSHSAFC